MIKLNCNQKRSLKSKTRVTVEYQLIKINEIYGITMVTNQNGITRSVSAQNISKSKIEVENLISYLYDNLIDDVHFLDVVKDYMLDKFCK